MLKIIQNERQPWSITLNSEKTSGPFDLTGNTEITVCFKAGSIITTLTKTAGRVVVDGDPVLGKISGHLTQAETDAMGEVNNGAIEVQVDFGSGDVRKTQILGAFSVTAKLC